MVVHSSPRQWTMDIDVAGMLDTLQFADERACDDLAGSHVRGATRKYQSARPQFFRPAPETPPTASAHRSQQSDSPQARNKVDRISNWHPGLRPRRNLCFQ